MHNFGTLYYFELKKIIRKKMVRIAFALILMLAAYMGIADIVSNVTTMTTTAANGTTNTKTFSGYDLLTERRDLARKLNGKPIDDQLFLKLADLNIALPFYSPVYNYVKRTMGSMEETLSATEETFYATVQENRLTLWQKQKLTEGEIAYWQEQDAKIPKPFVFCYTEGYENILFYFFPLCFLSLLFISISVSGVFSEEHSHRTDQLTLCTKGGKNVLYLAKYAAGLTLGLTASALFGAAMVLSILCVYDADGSSGILQISYFVDSALPLTMGQTVLIFFAVYLLAAVLQCIFTMTLSEVFGNSTAVMALLSGVLFLTMAVELPYKFRVLSQVWSLLPTRVLSNQCLTDGRLIKIFGRCLTNLQAAPILYLLLSLVLAAACYRKYKNYQVTGR